MKNTKFDGKDIFGNLNTQDTISPKQITKLNNFFNQNDVNINIKFNLNIFSCKPKKDKKAFEPSAPVFQDNEIPLPKYDVL